MHVQQNPFREHLEFVFMLSTRRNLEERPWQRSNSLREFFIDWGQVAAVGGAELGKRKVGGGEKLKKKTE